MQPKSSNLLRLNTRLRTKVSNILLLNLLFSILLPSLVGRKLIIGGYYTKAELLDSNLLI